MFPLNKNSIATVGSLPEALCTLDCMSCVPACKPLHTCNRLNDQNNAPQGGDDLALREAHLLQLLHQGWGRV